MSDPQLEAALREFEVAANNFATRLIKMAEVRSAYFEQIAEMSQSVRGAVDAGEMSPKRGAEIANQMRNEIMEMQRARDFDLGRSLAQNAKTRGITLEEAIQRAMTKQGVGGRAFNSLNGEEQARIFREVVDASGRSNPKYTSAIPKLRWAARGLWIASFAVAGYNIGTAEDPWWQSGREAANLAGGFGGGFAGGAAMGAVGGVWAGPVGVAVGVVVGGILGALLADHAYVEAVGTMDSQTRQFVDRFTGFWTGTDETKMAQALATEHGQNPEFIRRVFLSLNDSYTSDSDDVALELVRFARSHPSAQQALKASPPLREVMIQLLDEGWTGADEQDAIRYLRTL